MDVHGNASSLLAQLPSRQAMLAGLGLETRRPVSTDVLYGVGLVGVGILIGAGLTWWLAPRRATGAEREAGEWTIRPLPSGPAPRLEGQAPDEPIHASDPDTLAIHHALPAAK